MPMTPQRRVDPPPMHSRKQTIIGDAKVLEPVVLSARAATSAPTDKISIERGIPAPVLHARNKYPFQEMLVGDSFFCTQKDGSVSSSAAWVQKKHGFKFTCRIVVENGVKGTRCWRVK